MSSALRTAIEDLRAALVDEDAGNGHVRDCAFEVVAAWDAEAERTPTQASAQYLTRLLRSLDADMAETCRHTDAAEVGVVPNFKRTLLELHAQVTRFVTPADVRAQRGRVHARAR